MCYYKKKRRIITMQRRTILEKLNDDLLKVNEKI